MSRSKRKRKKGSAPRSRRPAWIWTVLGLATLAAAVIVLRQLPPENIAPVPPEIPTVESTEGVDPLVLEAIDEAVADLRANPTDGDLFGELGKVYQAHEYHALARHSYESAARLSPDDALWPYLLAIYADERGEPDNAADLLERSIELDPDYPPAYRRLGETRLATGDLDRAAAAYESFLSTRGEPAWGFIGLGRVARRRGDLAQAADHFETALDRDPGHRQAAFLLASTNRRLGRVDNAAVGPAPGSEAGERLAADPRLSDIMRRSAGLQARVVRANTLLESGSAPQAELLYREVLERDPGHYTALTNLGNALGRQDRPGEALPYLQRAVAMEPDNPHAYFGLALVHLSQGRVGEAREQLEAVLRLDPAAENASRLLARIPPS